MSPTLLLLAAALATVAPRSGPVSLATYRAHIHAARQLLDRAAPGSADTAAEAARLLRGLDRVRLPRGAGIVYTGVAFQAAALRSRAPFRVGRATKWLDALDDELAADRTGSVPAARLAALDTVLRDPRFHPIQTPFDRLGEWLQSLYRRLLQALDHALQPGSPSSLVPAVLLLALVAGVAVLLARGALGRLVVERSADEERVTPSTPESAMDRAEECASAGRYRDALRFLFLATLLQLQGVGLLELRPGRTNREYLQDLRASSAGSDEPLRALTDTFDAVWYGHRHIDEAGFRAAREEARRAVAALGAQVA